MDENQNNPDLSQGSDRQQNTDNQNYRQPNDNQGYQQPDTNNQSYQQQPNNNQGYQPYQQPYQQQYQQYQQPYQPKSKVAAGVLGILLGAFGVHNFYLGYVGKAVAQLLITVLTCGICAVASSIWGLIEGILILTGSIAVDGHGVPLRD